MPWFDYVCTSCGKIKENIIHKAIESPEILCDDCKSKMIRKIDARNFHLKGIGWGKDGYDKQSVKKIMDWKQKKQMQGRRRK